MTHEQAIAKLEADIRLRRMSEYTVKEYRTKAQILNAHSATRLYENPTFWLSLQPRQTSKAPIV